MSKASEQIAHGIPEHISRVIDRWCENRPEHLALAEASGAWTYGELKAIVAATRAWLSDLGIRPGDRVMIVGENCRAFVAVLLAAADLSAWPVLVSARLSPGKSTWLEITVAPDGRFTQLRHLRPHQIMPFGTQPLSKTFLTWEGLVLGT